MRVHSSPSEAVVRNRSALNVWEGAGVVEGGSAAMSPSSLFRTLMHWFGMPRDTALAGTFCEALRGRRVLLYGAGTLTRALLRRLPADVQVSGIVDRMADGGASFLGYPLISPSEAAGMSFDHILVAHNAYEMEMRRGLLEVGIPEDRIITLHTDEYYGSLAEPLIGKLVERACRRPVDAVVISCGGIPIVDNERLAEILPADRTVCFFMGRGNGEIERDGAYEVFDFQESLEALRRALLMMKPKVVYVRTILYKNYIGVMVKDWLPSAKVVHEFYDFGIMWPDDDLVSLFGLNATSIGWLRRAERIAGQGLDMVISKRGGREWGDVWRDCRTTYRMIFPQVTLPEGGEEEASGEVGDLVYAGFLPAPSFLRTFSIGYNFLPLLEAVCRDGGMTADIFNSSHTGDQGDEIFVDYLKRYSGRPITYHPRMPYAALISRMRGYRFGWLCNDQTTFHGDRRVGICNRWTGYISAGLPVLLDESWGFMGDLVREYGAGIILHRLDAETVIEAVREADHQSLRVGTARLRSKLSAENEGALRDLSDVVEAGMKGG